VVDAEIGPVRAQRLGRDGQIDRLEERIRRRARLRLRRGRPVPEREETYCLHEDPSLAVWECSEQAARRPSKRIQPKREFLPNKGE
jgi:hypothetical protein